MADQLGPNRRHVRLVIELNVNDELPNNIEGSDTVLQRIKSMGDELVQSFEMLGLEPGEVMVQVEDGGLLE